MAHQAVVHTSVVDVGGRQLIDIVAVKTAESAARWFREQAPEWGDGIRWVVLDMSGAYHLAYDEVLTNALQVADPFHVVRVRHEALCLRVRVRDPCRWAVTAVR